MAGRADRRGTRRRRRPARAARERLGRGRARRTRRATVARGGARPGDRRDLLLPALHALQVAGRVDQPRRPQLRLPSDSPSRPPRRTASPPSTRCSARSRRPRTVVHVCDDIACRVGGERCSELERLGPRGRRPDGAATWLRSPCLGLCEQAPAALVQRAGDDATDDRAGQADGAARRIMRVLSGASGRGVRAADRSRVAPRRRRRTRPSGEPAAPAPRRRRRPVLDRRLPSARRLRGAPPALELGPGRRIREVTDSKLMGRGGAAFPTGVKWKAVAEQPVHPHYFVCNADESEPGTFKDRVVMEQDPFAVSSRSRSRASPPGASRATSTSAASTRSRPSGCARDRGSPRATGSWATT